MPLRGSLALFAAGLVLAGCHEAFDLSLGLPGHFGLIWMAGLMLARGSSTLSFAATTTAFGYAAGGAGFDGFGAAAWHHAATHAPAYLVPALIVDAAARASRGHLVSRTSLAGVAGGVAFAVKPAVLALLVAVFELKAGSLRHGLAFPMLTHLCFGAVGAVIGSVLYRGLTEARRRPQA